MTVSLETRIKMSHAAKNRCDDKWKKNQSNSKRTKIDDSLLRKLYLSGKTQIECAEELNVGMKVISNAIKRLNIKPRKAAKRNQYGQNNHMWKGESANIISKHKRIYRAFGQPKKCDVCGTTDEERSYDWANLTGDYDNPADYKRMCRSCHWRYDKTHENFKKGTTS